MKRAAIIVITVPYSKEHSELKVSPEQEAIIKMYAERVGEKIGRLVSEIIVDSLTLLWSEKPASQPSVVIREQPTSGSLLNSVEVAKKLGISKAKAYQLMQRKEIPTVCMDGRYV